MSAYVRHRPIRKNVLTYLLIHLVFIVEKNLVGISAVMLVVIYTAIRSLQEEIKMI